MGKYAAEELRADKEVVLAAVMHDGSALAYASDELRRNEEVVSAARKSLRPYEPSKFEAPLGTKTKDLGFRALNVRHESPQVCLPNAEPDRPQLSREAECINPITEVCVCEREASTTHMANVGATAPLMSSVNAGTASE